MERASFEAPVPRDAASVVLARSPFEVYLTLRPRSLDVAGGFYVFPGGVVDDEDGRGLTSSFGSQGTAGLGEEPRVAIAAIREVFEEVGLLLAYDEEGRPLWRREVASAPEVAVALKEARASLLAGTQGLVPLLQRHGWRPAFDHLRYLGRWITPPTSPRRFDTRFFMADVSGCADPAPHPGEVEKARWVPLEQALEDLAAGTLSLMPPTIALLHALHLHSDVKAASSFFADPSRRRFVVEGRSREPRDVALATVGIVRIPITSANFSPWEDSNVYLIVRRGEALVIDAGSGGTEGARIIQGVWEQWERPRVVGLFFTHGHPDHCRSAMPLVELLAPEHIWAHPLERDAIEAWASPLRVRHLLHGGEWLQVGDLRLQVLHTPGHSRGHLSLWLPDHGVLFVGDLATESGSVWVGPPDGNLVDYLATLDRLARLPARVAAPGHGLPFANPARRLRQTARRRLEREEQIFSLLRQRPRSVEELLTELYGDQGPAPIVEMARRTVRGHLEKLLAEGRIAPLSPGEEVFRSLP